MTATERNPMKLPSRVALVTGGAQGIGLACAQRFALEGARVAIVDRDAERGERAARDLATPGVFIQGDVAQDDTAARAVREATERLGPIDILLNNAGITHAANFLDLRIEDFDRVLGINLRSYVLFGQAVARQMVERQAAGSIIHMSSVNAVLAIPNQVPYVVSKGAVNQLTRVMAMALAPHKIRRGGGRAHPARLHRSREDTRHHL